MENYDWSKFTIKIPIDAGVQRIYEMLSTRTGMESWFLRLAEFSKADQTPWGVGSAIEEGDQYRWLWYGYDDDMVETGKITKANGKDQIQFTFAGNCLVTISIYHHKENVSMVELTQENIPADEESRVKYHLGCMTGWTFYLANLKSILGGGLDLRNKNVKLQGVINS
ncbi:MAG TPA: SRPBCC domain-containing protein [Daejeonella sp.]|nr:SRPBCC domain-containing protein [Daejeonella sp.]